MFPQKMAETFEAFLKRLEPRLKRLLAVYRMPREDAEEVLQQALLALLYQWESVGDPEHWLLGTLKRHCLMHWRKSRLQVPSERCDPPRAALQSARPVAGEDRAALPP